MRRIFDHKWKEVGASWRKLYNWEVYNLYSSKIFLGAI
jgi:hypothetical protein